MTDAFIGIAGLLGLAGSAWILARKIPLLLNLPDDSPWNKEAIQSLVHHLVAKTKTGKMLSSPEYALQKVLSVVRVAALRVEHATSRRLEDLRQQTKEAQEKFSRPYWDRVKRTKSK